ncbi:hypothetical protein ANN_27070 [Periplaneta americana]|uniref:C2H2-type domain-containing protein n=1 Tax=Periplaneta americana TaxID=6978 RepID=A0ABQ8RX54_PERAM|nr:hypothetical protein ANN_27070 [Periplaneta americana]
MHDYDLCLHVSTSVKPICHKNLPTISCIQLTTSQEIPSHPSTLETKRNRKSISITQMSPIPGPSKTTSKRRSSNTKQHSEILTASPMKEKLEVLEKRRADKQDELDEDDLCDDDELDDINPNTLLQEVEEICAVCGEFGEDGEVWFRCTLFKNAISTTRLFSFDEIGDSKMVFGEMRPRIRHRLPGIDLTVGENLGKNPTSQIPGSCLLSARFGEQSLKQDEMDVIELGLTKNNEVDSSALEPDVGGKQEEGPLFEVKCEVEGEAWKFLAMKQEAKEDVAAESNTALLRGVVEFLQTGGIKHPENTTKSSSSVSNHKRKKKVFNDKHDDINVSQTPYSCVICGKAYAYYSSLFKHIRTHSEKSFQCVTCGKYFAHRGALTAHERLHLGLKPFKCDVCDRRYPVRGLLMRHYRIHTGEKPFQCDVCGKLFFERTHLVTHSRTHTKEKPFECDYCGKGFAQRGDLIKHLRTHTAEKPFKCEVCDKGFSDRGKLVKHGRIHTGEKPCKCDVCGKAFSERGNLINHVRTHTGEKPFKCEFCYKGFAQRGSLIAHCRTHTGEKPFRCDICGKGFTQRGQLQSHSRTHTTNRPLKFHQRIL